MFEADIKSLFSEAMEVALAVAEVRDKYFKVRHREGRFLQLSGVNSELNTVADALHHYIEMKRPLFGRKPDREIVMIARAAVENGKALVEIAQSEVSLLQERQLQRDNQMAKLREAVRDEKLSKELRDKAARALRLGEQVELSEKHNRLKTGR